MAAFPAEYDSDLSDEEEEGGQEVSAWLEEEDIEEDEPVVKKAVVEVQPKIDIVHKTQYIIDNLDLFYALCELEDWEFEKNPDDLQEELMKTLHVEEYKPGESIIVEGDTGNDLYIVVASEETAASAEVEVVNQNILAGTEVFLTRLRRGQFFGQKFFVTRRVNKRGATVRVPSDSPTSVKVARLSAEFFDHWESFRNLLLVKTVPLVQKLPRKERSQILQHLQVREFKDGDYIIKQGEKGEDFFIIQEGSVKVVETRPSPEKGWESPMDVVLVTLREGHFFGEMSLVTDEPRVASVISIKSTICLSLSKSVFRSALSDETFNEVLTEVLSKRKEIRKQREEREQQQEELSPASFVGSPVSRRSSYRTRTPSSVSEVSVSTTLSMRKLESGSRVINKYIVERELGKGSFGEVYLCRDIETNNEYAMKQISRPSTSSWNDESSNAIRQEIAVMKRLKHQNVVGLHEVIDDQNARKIFLIQEFMEGGPLMDDAETCEPLDPTLARKYFRDILRGVCYLHYEGVIHRDIKPQNMLLASSGTVKIADFGAAVFTDGLTKVAFGGTPAFMAPELFLTNKERDFTKSPGIDIFALGATLYYMVVGRPPWMAKNQIDLATKIKNIELTFPSEHVDPHMKHLLRQMLAKDYRLRCNLDTIVVDDWVTFEGSDPLFEKDDFLVQEFVDFQSVLLLDDPTTPQPPLHILVVHPSLVTRTMFHQQVNGFTPAVCVGASTAEESISIMQSAMHSHPQANFDYIFIELLLPTKTFALNTVTYIRQLGFKGKIVGMTVSAEDMDDFLKDGKVDSVVRRPIALRELTLLLTKTKLEENADNMLHNHGAPPVAKITAEEFDNAITFNASMASHSRSTSALSVSFNEDISVAPSTKASMDADDDLDDENVKDFDTYTSASEERNMESPADADMSRLSLVDKGGLMRKRAFMVVPYGASSDDRGAKESEPAVNPDRPLKILNIKEDDGSRRLRREQAMKRSTLAHQYRVAKKEGDHDRITSSRSLLTLMKCQSKKSMKLERKSTRSLDDTDLPSPMLRHKSKAASQALHSVSMRHIDEFISNTVTVPDGDDKVDSDSNLEDSDEEEESVLDSSSDDDDFGLDSDDIKQLDNDTFEEEFSKLIRKKSANDSQELADWNHIMVGVDFKNKLKCDPNMSNAELQLVVGMDENMVSRAYMEDRTYAEVKVEERAQQHRPSAAMFAVFDGHNGDYVAQALKERYGSQFMQLLKEYEDRVRLGQEDKSHYEAKIGHIFERANALLDRDILEKDYARQQKSLHAGIQDMQTYAGSVGVIALIMPAHPTSLQRQSSRVESLSLSPRDSQSTGKRLQVFISHVGDCRAVLSHDGTAVQLTEDHKANLKHEKARIENAGGWVHNGRVNGALGVSRSFGDIQFKNFEHCQGHNGDEHESKGIWGQHQQVVSKPDYTHFIIEDAYEFMILACDGLWDVFSCQEAVNFVRKRLSVTMNVQQTAKDLISKAIERGTQDNTSVIVVAFHQ